jgi:hypothetical protein
VRSHYRTIISVSNFLRRHYLLNDPLVELHPLAELPSLSLRPAKHKAGQARSNLENCQNDKEARP